MQTNLAEKEEQETDIPLTNLKKFIFQLTKVGDLEPQISNGCMDLQAILIEAVEKKILPLYIFKKFDKLMSRP